MKKAFTVGRHPRERLLFLDECNLNTSAVILWSAGLQPLLGDNWQPRGRQNRIPAAGKHQKCHCFGALDFCDARFSFQLSDRKRSCEFVHFLEALASGIRPGCIWCRTTTPSIPVPR